MHPKVPLNRYSLVARDVERAKREFSGCVKTSTILSSSLLFGKALSLFYATNERETHLYLSTRSHLIQFYSRATTGKNWLRALLLRSKARTKQKSTSVKVKTEAALRRFRKQVMNSGHINEVRRRRYFENKQDILEGNSRRRES